MSLNGLVHPFPVKCESANWRWIRANQLAPQGLGPVMSTVNKCDYGEIGPYINPQVKRNLERVTQYRYTEGMTGYPYYNVRPNC